MIILNQIIRFFDLSFKEKLLMVEACFYLLWFSFLIHIMPYRWWESSIGQKMQTTREIIPRCEEERVIKNIRISVFRTNRVLNNFGKCFSISLTIKRMLERRKIVSTVFIGVRKENSNKLLAHAWLKHGESIVYGGPQGPRRYQKLLSYT